MSKKAYALARRRILNNAKRRSQTTLDLNNKGIFELPPEIGELNSLKTLNLSGNNLTSLPLEITSLTSLNHIDISQNNFDAIPPQILKMPSLIILDASGNKISSLPLSVGDGSNIATLKLSSNRLSEFPAAILQMTKLRELELRNNQIQQIPPEIAKLRLNLLRLDANALRSLPDEIGEIRTLNFVGLSKNNLSSLPPKFSQLSSLALLDLEGNSFESVPKEIRSMIDLQLLYIEKNQIKELPSWIGHLTKLKVITAYANQISKIPKEIGNLQLLEELNIRENLIETIPREVGLLRDLIKGARGPFGAGLSVHNNPLPHPYPALIAAGQPSATENVLAWLRDEIDVSELKNAEKQSEEEEEDDLTDRQIEGVLRQRPASFRFRVRNGRIDTAPTVNEIPDYELATDLVGELLFKANALKDRLVTSNADRRAVESVSRLLTEIEKEPQKIRPGILLSRSRSIEADRNAFDSEQGRQELFPDAIAMMDDVLLSLQDLMTIFPVIREIEAERLALAIQSDELALEIIETNTEVIQSEAETSEIVTKSAAAALKEIEPDIRSARSLTIRARLVADQLLVIRNFAGEAAHVARQRIVESTKHATSEFSELSSKSWDEVKQNFPQGVGAAARALPIVLLIALLAAISGPVAGIAGAAAAFRPLSKALNKIIESAAKKPKKAS